MKKNLPSFLMSNMPPLAAIAIFFFLAMMEGHPFAWENYLEYCDNLIFPLWPLDKMFFPFQNLMHSLWLHCPAWLEWIKNIYILLPAALSFTLSRLAHSRMAGTAAFILSVFFYSYSFRKIDFEQTIIASCVLMSLGTYFMPRGKPRIRILFASAALAAAMHSKGVCIPFAAFMFLALLTECIKSKKSLMTLALCFLIVAAGAESWSITATKEGRVPVGLTESNSRMIPNMIAGAMGIIHTTEGPIIQAYAEKSDLSKKEIFIKAAKIAWNNPGQVLKAPFLRTFALFREMPFTLAALVLFFLSFLKISTFKKTFVLYMSVFYFFGIYIIMPIEGRYFITSIYLMCCCGGMFLADLYAIAKKIAAKYGFEIKNKPAETENRAYSSFILSACIIPHFFIWLLSILLLVSFPSRQKIADADDYLKIFPENSMLLKYPLRKGYPAAHDIKERLALYEKISNTRKSTNWKLRALKFMAEGQDMENPDYGKISRTYRYPDEEGLAWQDILTDSFRHFGAGNIKSGETYAQAAIISCMLSHGYVRLANVQEQKLSLSLAQENAGRCSDNYAEFVFALPPWHSAVKRNFLDSEAYGLLFEENAKALFEKKQMQDCSECCIEKNDRKFLSKCLEKADKSYILTDSWEKIMDDISVTPAITHRFPALERVKEKNKKHETQNPDDIETGIKVLESFYSIFDKEIMDKAKTNPEIKNLKYFRYKDETAYDLAHLYYEKGDNRKSLYYLSETLKGRKDFKYRNSAITLYYKLKQLP